MSETMIAITKIRPPIWNSRLINTPEALNIDQLAASLSSEGQMNAVNVEGPDDDGMYDLVAGSRRIRAAILLGWTEVRATVDAPTEVAHRIVKNVVENLQRKDLTLYEQARACSKLRDEKLKLKEIAEKTGLSEQYVSNLTTMYKTLPTIVLKAWEAGESAATFDYLRELATLAKSAKSPEEGAEVVLAKWQTRTALYKDFAEDLAEDDLSDAMDEDEETAKKKKPKKEPSTDFKVSGTFYAALIADIRASKLPGAPLAIQACRVLAGELDEIKGVFPSTETQNAGKNTKPKVNKKGKE